MLAAIAGLFLLVPGAAQAAPVADGVFDLPDQAKRLALGPDGNIWVTLASASPDLARVAPDGTVTPFTSGQFGATVTGITAGPDGNMWVTGTNFAGKFSPANPAGATKTTINEIGSANGIVVGQDGNLWTGSDGNVVKIPPANPAGYVPIPSGVANFSAREIASASDGRLWVANGDGANAGLLPVTLAGVPGPYLPASAPEALQGVAAGPNGQIAYSQPNANPQRIGLVNNNTLAPPFIFPAPADPNGVTFGQDGAYWFALSNPSAIGRYTTDGVYAKFADMPANSFPRRISQGANNTIWVILERPGELFSRIARISGVENPDVLAPAYSGLKLTNTKFRVGKKSTALVAKAKKKAKAGTTLSYTLSEIATTSIAVQKATTGRKSGTSCVKPTKSLKKAKKCTRYAVVKTLTRLQLAGANKVSFSGRIGKTKLKAGKYRFSVTGKDANGNTSLPVTKAFTIVKK
ncbi:MAG: hypothetical protein JHC98_09805 [Thermoleophilaceae bacterium]|nr:hypothetical protein [Thermoleophilaceae bacterium]